MTPRRTQDRRATFMQQGGPAGPQQSMRASKSLFSTGEPAYGVNRGGVIMAWNPAAESTFGFSESEAMGQHCWELLAGHDLFGNQTAARAVRSARWRFVKSPSRAMRCS